MQDVILLFRSKRSVEMKKQNSLQYIALIVAIIALLMQSRK